MLSPSINQIYRSHHALSTVWGDLPINERWLTPSQSLSSTPILLITHAHLHGSLAYWLLTADCNLAVPSTLILIALPFTVFLDAHAGSLAWPTGLVIVIGDPLTSREPGSTISGSRLKRTSRVRASCGVKVLWLVRDVVWLTLGLPGGWFSPRLLSAGSNPSHCPHQLGPPPPATRSAVWSRSSSVLTWLVLVGVTTLQSSWLV